jgi:hypothetical protein
MRIQFVLALALCSAVLASNDVNKADHCMYNQVSLMSLEGQKLAFQLTRTEVSVHTKTTYHTVTETVQEDAIGINYVATEQDVSSHGGWQVVCEEISTKCETKRGLKSCRQWKKACDNHDNGFNWTVGPGTILNTLPDKLIKNPILVIQDGKNKDKKGNCYARALRKSKKVCILRNKKGDCDKHRKMWKINKCLEWKNVMKKKWVPTKSEFVPNIFYAIVKKHGEKKRYYKKLYAACKNMEKIANSKNPYKAKVEIMASKSEQPIRPIEKIEKARTIIKANKSQIKIAIKKEQPKAKLTLGQRFALSLKKISFKPKAKKVIVEKRVVKPKFSLKLKLGRGLRLRKHASHYIKCGRWRRRYTRATKRFSSWKRRFTKAVKKYARKHKKTIAKTSFFKQRKQYRECKKKIAKKAKTQKWISYMTTSNAKRVEKLNKKYTKILAIKDAQKREKKLVKYFKLKKSSEKKFKVKWARRMAESCKCRDEFEKFRVARKEYKKPIITLRISKKKEAKKAKKALKLKLSLKLKSKKEGRKLQKLSIKVKTEKKQKKRFSLFGAIKSGLKKTKNFAVKVGKGTKNLAVKVGKGTKNLAVKVGKGTKNLAVKVGKGTKNLAVKVGKGSKNLAKKLAKKAKKLAKKAKKLAKKLRKSKISKKEVKSCFVAQKGGKFLEKLKQVCVHRNIKWTDKAEKRFKCISRSQKHVIHRCSKWTISKNGRTVCTKKAKLFGVKICKKFKKGECKKHKVVFPKSMCSKHQAFGKKNLCIRLKFFRPVRFCKSYKLRKNGQRKCKGFKALFGSKFFKTKCVKFFTKGGKCKKNKVVKRKAFKKFDIKMQCMKCKSYRKIVRQRRKRNAKIFLKKHVKNAKKFGLKWDKKHRKYKLTLKKSSKAKKEKKSIKIRFGFGKAGRKLQQVCRHPQVRKEATFRTFQKVCYRRPQYVRHAQNSCNRNHRVFVKTCHGKFCHKNVNHRVFVKTCHGKFCHKNVNHRVFVKKCHGKFCHKNVNHRVFVKTCHGKFCHKNVNHRVFVKKCHGKFCHKIVIRKPTVTIRHPVKVTIRKPTFTIRKPTVVIRKPTVTIRHPVKVTIRKPTFTIRKPTVVIRKPTVTIRHPVKVTIKHPVKIVKKPVKVVVKKPVKIVKKPVKVTVKVPVKIVKKPVKVTVKVPVKIVKKPVKVNVKVPVKIVKKPIKIEIKKKVRLGKINYKLVKVAKAHEKLPEVKVFKGVTRIQDDKDWTGIKFRTIIDAENSSVENYSATIYKNSSKFTAADRTLIQVCSKYF